MRRLHNYIALKKESDLRVASVSVCEDYISDELGSSILHFEVGEWIIYLNHGVTEEGHLSCAYFLRNDTIIFQKHYLYVERTYDGYTLRRS